MPLQLLLHNSATLSFHVLAPGSFQSSAPSCEIDVTTDGAEVSSSSQGHGGVAGQLHSHFRVDLPPLTFRSMPTVSYVKGSGGAVAASVGWSLELLDGGVVRLSSDRVEWPGEDCERGPYGMRSTWLGKRLFAAGAPGGHRVRAAKLERELARFSRPSRELSFANSYPLKLAMPNSGA